MPWTDWWPMPWFGMMFGPIFMLAVFLLLVLAVMRGFGVGWRGRGPADPPQKTARDILDERYARGEIEKSEYDSRRRDIAA